MERARKILAFFRKEQKARKNFLLINGSLLLEEIIVSFNGSHNIPTRSFTSKELFRATNGFKEKFYMTANGSMFKGSFEQRPIIVVVKRATGNCFDDTISSASEAIHDMVITSQMSHHKNVLKLLGSCMEYEFPALVYEYAGTELVSDMLCNNLEDILPDRSLSWKRRLKIAKDIANVVVYLHTAFPTPIVHRDIRLANVFIDQFAGVAKLFDFSLCISLPPGESQVQVDDMRGMMGSIDPEYCWTGIVTEKIDVFHFGMLLFQLLTGRNNFYFHFCYKIATTFIDYVKVCVDNEKLYEILDPRILADEGGTEQVQQMQALIELALKCFQDKGEDRPEMIDVAKELRRIERLTRIQHLQQTEGKT